MSTRPIRRLSSYLVTSLMFIVLSTGSLSIHASSEETEAGSVESIKKTMKSDRKTDKHARKSEKKHKKKNHGKDKPQAIPDTDGDGVANSVDRCPTQQHCSQRTSRAR